MPNGQRIKPISRIIALAEARGNAILHHEILSRFALAARKDGRSSLVRQWNLAKFRKVPLLKPART
jgi:hypothetical protein